MYEVEQQYLDDISFKINSMNRKIFDFKTAYDLEYASPITIKDGCWIASNVIVCGGVTIGKDTIIGAGSVVTKDIPEGVFAAGNPCKVIRKITEDDSILLKKHLY